MKMKRMASVLLAIALATSLVACGTNGNNKTSSSGKTKITFWHIWPDAEMNQIVNDYVEKFEKENPDIDVEAVATQEAEYQNTKLKVAVTNGSQGDVFMSWGGGYAKQFVDAGVVLPLDDYLAESGAIDQILDGSLEYGTYDDKVYGLPLKQWAGALFCNTELFDEYNVKIPETWDEFLTAVKTFQSNDVTPLVLGAKDAWHIGMIQNALAVRTAGAEYLNKALIGEASLDTPEIVESAKLLTELNDAGAFPKGTMGLGAEESQEEFYMGLIPMYFGGSWVAAGCDSSENNLQGKVKVVPMPSVENEKGGQDQFSGGVIDFFMVNSKTEHPDEAYKFAEGITKYMSEECYKIGDSLPAWKLDNVDESGVSPTLQEVNKLIQSAHGYVLAWDTFLQGAAIDQHYQLLQGLIAGTTTPEEFAKGMQEAQEVEMSGQSN